MRLPLRHREPPPALPGVTGPVRIAPTTRELLRRIGPGDVALLEEVDLDQVTAEALLSAEVAAVVNIAPSISGRYPAQGAAALVAAEMPFLDDVGTDVVGRVKDGDAVRVDGRELLIGKRVIAEGRVPTADDVAAAMEQAASGLRSQLEAFAGSTPALLDTELSLILDGAGLPAVSTAFEGRPALVVVRGPRDRADLDAVQTFIQEQRPVLLGVDGGADVLLAAGYHPDLVLGDMDGVSDEALGSGAELVVHALRDGRAAGLDRAGHHHATPLVVTSDAGSEDLAILLAVHRGSTLVVTAGTADGLVELLDRDRPGMPSAVLTRLQAGDRLVDATSVAVLQRREVSWTQILLILLAGLVAVAAAVAVTPSGQHWIDQLAGQ
jgi:uncharacterized membrane-anchored protein